MFLHCIFVRFLLLFLFVVFVQLFQFQLVFGILLLDELHLDYFAVVVDDLLVNVLPHDEFNLVLKLDRNLEFRIR